MRFIKHLPLIMLVFIFSFLVFRLSTYLIHFLTISPFYLILFNFSLSLIMTPLIFAYSRHLCIIDYLIFVYLAFYITHITLIWSTYLAHFWILLISLARSLFWSLNHWLFSLWVALSDLSLLILFFALRYFLA
jgi:hypothetical protein